MGGRPEQEEGWELVQSTQPPEEAGRRGCRERGAGAGEPAAGRHGVSVGAGPRFDPQPRSLGKLLSGLSRESHSGTCILESVLAVGACLRVQGRPLPEASLDTDSWSWRRLESGLSSEPFRK